MTVNLSQQGAQFVSQQIAAGVGSTADEVVDQALRLYSAERAFRANCTPLESGELEGEELEQHVVELLSNDGGFPDYPPEIDAKMQRERDSIRAHIAEGIRQLDAGEGIEFDSEGLDRFFERLIAGDEFPEYESSNRPSA